MSHVSADNAQVSDRVESIKTMLAQYHTALRGAVAESLAGISAGTVSLLNKDVGLADLTTSFLQSTAETVLEDLGNVAESALQASLRATDASVPEGTQDVVEALVRAFSSDLERDFDLAGGKSMRLASNFIVQAQLSGRAFATSEQLVHDLEFNTTDAMGRNLTIADFLFRQVNWAYRTLYNTVMVHVLLNKGVDDAQVDGGSKSGTILDLGNFDQVAPTYFHHNSKSLLKPLD